MGLSADAHLIFGIPITALNDEGDAYPWWSAEADDWVDLAELEAVARGYSNPWNAVPSEIYYSSSSSDFNEWQRQHPEWRKLKEGWYAAKRDADASVRIEIVTYGHYDDPDGPRAIIAPKGVPQFRGDAWEPRSISSLDLNVRDKLISKADEHLQVLEWPLSMRDAQWNLVASYG